MREKPETGFFFCSESMHIRKRFCGSTVVVDMLVSSGKADKYRQKVKHTMLITLWATVYNRGYPCRRWIVRQTARIYAQPVRKKTPAGDRQEWISHYSTTSASCSNVPP